MSLRGRLSLVFALGTAALVIIAAAMFLSQLRSSLTAALDDALRTRSATLAAQLRAGSLPADGPVETGRANQTGQQAGQFGGADEFTQVLSPGGAVLYPAEAERPAPLLTRDSSPRPSTGGSPPAPRSRGSGYGSWRAALAGMPAPSSW